MRGRILFAIGVAVAATVVIGTALAAIVSTSGGVSGEVHRGSPPASVALNQHEHDDDTGNPSGAHAFDEEQDYVTKAPIALDNCTTATSAFVTCPVSKSGRIRDTADMRAGTIPAGTCIDSHFIHADPPLAPVAGVVYTGTVNFDSQILGVIVTTANLVASDADPGLGPSPVTYDATPTRGLELDTEADEFTINTNPTTQRVQFVFDVRVTMDQIRVITLGDCPGQAAELTLTPGAASNQVGTQHCVTATAKTETGGPAEDVVIRFDVDGASEQDQSPPDEDASKSTDENGVAEHCYTGPETVGADTIHAYADNDEDNTQDNPTEPFADATKTWTAAEAHTLVLEPKVAENPVDTQHCVTATVRDVFLNPTPGERVEFDVTGTVTKHGTDQTDDSGVAEFCYSSTTAGLDTIVAFVDSTEDDPLGEITGPRDTATKTWTPGDPATLSLDPKLAENRIQEQHCVTATVRDAFQNAVPDVTVRFQVTGVNTKTGAQQTDEAGQAQFCYTGGTTAGGDVITAYADEDNDGTRDAGETAADTATKTWLPLEPAILTLTPKVAQNIVNEQHCVQAHVTDVFLNPNPNETVYFVVTGTTTKQAAQQTDGGGIAEFCYTSTKAGTDAIHAWVDSITENGEQDEGEPFDDATKVWHPGDPAVLDLKPDTDTNEVGTQHCVKAEVRDAFGNPTPDELIRFNVEGASETDTDPADEDGSDRTDEFGNAEHCYTGPDLPGVDTIHAYADNNEDNQQNADEPAQDTVEKTWVFPASTPGCEVTIHDGGWIETATASKGTFGGNARIERDGTITRGQLQYQDHNELMPLNFHSVEVVAIVCPSDPGQRADVYGTGRLNGLPVDFRVRVRDVGEPAAGRDTYQLLAGPYVSGPEDNPLLGGNIQVRRF